MKKVKGNQSNMPESVEQRLKKLTSKLSEGFKIQKDVFTETQDSMAEVKTDLQKSFLGLYKRISDLESKTDMIFIDPHISFEDYPDADFTDAPPPDPYGDYPDYADNTPYPDNPDPPYIDWSHDDDGGSHENPMDEIINQLEKEFGRFEKRLLWIAMENKRAKHLYERQIKVLATRIKALEGKTTASKKE